MMCAYWSLISKGIKYVIIAYYIWKAVLGRSGKMENEVMEKLELFLQNLRCDNTKRETLVHLNSCRKESERLAELDGEYRHVMNKMDQYSRVIRVLFRPYIFIRRNMKCPHYSAEHG